MSPDRARGARYECRARCAGRHPGPGRRDVPPRRRPPPGDLERHRPGGRSACDPHLSGGAATSASSEQLTVAALERDRAAFARRIDKLTERPEVADVRTSVIDEHLRNHAVTPDPSAPEL